MTRHHYNVYNLNDTSPLHLLVHNYTGNSWSQTVTTIYTHPLSTIHSTPVHKYDYNTQFNRSRGKSSRIVDLPVTVHVRKFCHTGTTVTCCNVHFFTNYSIFNSALIHYLVVVVINFVISSNIVIIRIVVIVYFYATCRGIENF